jgi:hypothetical protein
MPSFFHLTFSFKVELSGSLPSYVIFLPQIVLTAKHYRWYNASKKDIVVLRPDGSLNKHI